MPFISFSCLIAVARTSNTMLNRNGESRYACLVPYVCGKALKFCPLNKVLDVGLSYMTFIMLRHGPSIPILLIVFILNGSYSLSNAFSASIDMIMCFFLSFFNVMYSVY